MSFKDKWTDKIDGVDDVLAEDINSIAREVIQVEEQLLGVDDALDAIIEIQNSLIGGDEQ